MSCKKRTVASTYLAPAEKALGENKTFHIDYTDDLAQVEPADTITNSTWAIDDPGLTETGGGFTEQITSIRVIGGTKIGNLFRLTNTVTTASGDTLVRLLTVKIVNIHVKRPDEEDVEFIDPTPLP